MKDDCRLALCSRGFICHWAAPRTALAAHPQKMFEGLFVGKVPRNFTVIALAYFDLYARAVSRGYEQGGTAESFAVRLK